MEPPRSHRAMIFKGWMFHSYVYHGYRLLISQIYIYDSYWFIMCFTSPFTCPITAIPMSEKKGCCPIPQVGSHHHHRRIFTPRMLRRWRSLQRFSCCEFFMLQRRCWWPWALPWPSWASGSCVSAWWMLRKELRWCIDCPDALIEWRWLVQLNNWHCGFSLTITNTQKDSN